MCALSYYAVVAPMLFGPDAVLATNTTASGGEVAAVAFACVVFHAAMAMLLWSYFAASFTDPGRVPPGWTPFAHSDAQPEGADAPLASSPAVAEAASGVQSQLGVAAHRQSIGHAAPAGGGALAAGHHVPDDPTHRFCRKCSAYKPHRTHHCSVLGRCVLKMDHYCVWVANTVGLLNYKFFLLFLLYTFVASTIAVALLVSQFAELFGGTPRPRSSRVGDADARAFYAGIAFIAFVIDLAFAVSIFGFLVMHAGLVARNMTTIEAYEKNARTPWVYDRGIRKNLTEVFGEAPWAWLLPLHADVWQASRRARAARAADDEAGAVPLTGSGGGGSAGDANGLHAAMVERHLCDLHGSRLQSGVSPEASLSVV